MPLGSLSLERDELRPLPAPGSAALPESIGYRWKMKLLGQPLDNDQLEHERLGKPTALAVFASDALSSTAYASEEILRVLVPAIGVLAFARVLPITLAMVVVLVILMFSYRQTIKAYPSAGGAYIVTKDNLGLMPAQVAGVALLTDYIRRCPCPSRPASRPSTRPSRPYAPTRCPSPWCSSRSSPGGTCAGSRSRGGSSPCRPTGSCCRSSS